MIIICLDCSNMDLIYATEDNHQLYLGDYSSALDIMALKLRKIGFVVTAAYGLHTNYTTQNIAKKVFPIHDVPSYNISKYFAESHEFIDEALKKGNILVHCAAGISRSATLVMAYLMKKLGLTYRKAYQMVRQKRKVVMPNAGFTKQLMAFEKTLNLPLQLGCKTLSEQQKSGSKDNPLFDFNLTQSLKVSHKISGFAKIKIKYPEESGRNREYSIPKLTTSMVKRVQEVKNTHSRKNTFSSFEKEYDDAKQSQSLMIEFEPTKKSVMNSTVVVPSSNSGGDENSIGVSQFRCILTNKSGASDKIFSGKHTIAMTTSVTQAK